MRGVAVEIGTNAVALGLTYRAANRDVPAFAAAHVAGRTAGLAGLGGGRATYGGASLAHGVDIGLRVASAAHL